MRPGAAFVPFAMVAVVLLAGCSGSTSGSPTVPGSGDPVSVVPTTSAPATPDPTGSTSSPAPVSTAVPADVPTTGPNLLHKGERPPVMPALATKHTPAGAVAFAKFFIRTIDWGYATTSSAYMDHYFSPRCDSCRAFSNGLRKAKRMRETFVGGRFKIRSAAAAAPNPQRGQQTAEITFNLGALATFNARHVFLDSQPGREGARFFVSMNWASGRWLTTWLSVAV